MSSAQRRSGRKRAANTRINDLPDSSPTQRPQPAKRKKANPTPRSRAHRRAPKVYEEEDDDEEEDVAENDTEVEEEDDDPENTPEDENQVLVDTVVRYLDVAPEEVAVARAYDTDRWAGHNANINAFAELRGRTWLYYVNEVKITIGRQSEDEDDKKNNASGIDIDLGPNKMISRLHAELFYEPETAQWQVMVHGRNGVRINDAMLKKNETRPIHNGDILAVASTQMLFRPADQPMTIPPFFLDKIRAAQAESEESVSPLVRRLLYPPSDPFLTTAVPSTEVNSTNRRPETPPPSQKIDRTNSAKKRTPQNRAMVMQTPTDTLDYSKDSAKDVKPACSYASMITWAILDTSDESLSLHGIYEWIKSHYAYYRETTSGWQNSIRHNLSLNTNFHKVPRRPDEPGKGMKWAFVPEYRDATIAAAKKNASKGGGRLNSAPASPVGNNLAGASMQIQYSMPSPSTRDDIKSSPPGPLPHLSSYPDGSQTRPQTSTPPRSTFEQQPPTPIYAPTQGHLPILSDQTSPLPRRYANGHLTTHHGSSPTLTSGAYGNNSDLPMATPAPRPYNLTVLQPNTAKLPTSHMTPTTPAPFWRPSGAGGTLGSTPARWPDSSPFKNGGNGGGGGPVMSSSPPPAAGSGPESPTRKGTGSSQQPTSLGLNFGGGGGGQGVNGRGGFGGGGSSSSQHVDNGGGGGGGGGGALGEDAEEGIDILKGFTKISAYHQQPHRNSFTSAQAR